MLVPLTLVAITILILIDSWPALTTFGLSYFTTTEWDPVKLVFGAAAYVYGTLVTTIVAVLLATPIATWSKPTARSSPTNSRQECSFIDSLYVDLVIVDLAKTSVG